MAASSQAFSRWWGRPVWAEIDLDALSHNVQTLKKRAGAASLAAVVKANAYGHGAVPVARAALAAGAQRLCVICVDEGEQLRRAGITAPILIMGHTSPSEAERIVELGLTPTVNSREMALALAAAASEQGIIQPVHLKVDTGLNRYGLPPAEVIALAQWLREQPWLQVEGLFTHFAGNDNGDGTYTLAQYRTFLEVAQRLSWIPLRHVANTQTLLEMPDLSLDMVRVGIGIYGCYPTSGAGRGLSLRPLLTLKSRLARLRPLPPGESVSYGRTWTAQRHSLIGLVMCGYADGLPRLLSNRGSVLVRGQRAPIVGRVCMDMCMVDVTDISGVQEEDEVVIIGGQGEAEITAEELGELCGTISYEILCGISARVPRLYLQEGRLVAYETLVTKSVEEALVPDRAGR